jgi:hypothetical protein
VEGLILNKGTDTVAHTRYARAVHGRVDWLKAIGKRGVSSLPPFSPPEMPVCLLGFNALWGEDFATVKLFAYEKPV